MENQNEFVPYEDEHGEWIVSPFQKLLKKPILNGTELLQLPVEPNDYLIDKILWKNQIVILLAKEKVGKSILSLQMACALSCGEQFLNEFDVARPLKVLYVQAEGDRYETINRLKSMISDQHVQWNPENFYHWFPPALSLDRQEGYDEFITKVTDIGIMPDVIFIDPLYLAMEGDLSDNKAARMFIRYVRMIQEKYRCALIIDHHEHRPIKEKQSGWNIQEGDNSIMGSFAWKAFASHVIRIELHKDKTRTMSCHTQRNGQVEETLKMDLVEHPLKFVVKSQEPPRNEQVKQIIAQFGRSVSKEEIVKAYGFSDSTVRKALQGLLKSKQIRRVNKGHIPALYDIKPKKEEPKEEKSAT